MGHPQISGVFCLEGPWLDDLRDQLSVRPMLEMLRALDVADYIYRTASTIPEFESVIERWLEDQYSEFAFGYMAFHGFPGGIQIGDELYDLDDFARLLYGKMTGRVLYFSSCSTLDIDETDAYQLLKATNARAICGYINDVGWLESAAFELNLLSAVTQYKRIDSGFRFLQKHYGDACDRLGLRAIWNGDYIW